VDALAQAAASGKLSVDLQARTVSSAATGAIGFAIAAPQREALLSGLDEVDQTLGMARQITLFQQQDRRARPWAYA
jgi:3-isopropylmalate/(R)-2-methylmalate dehydratase small subunit